MAVNSARGANGGATWTPTVAHLIVLIILEIAAFAAIRYAFGVLTRGH